MITPLAQSALASPQTLAFWLAIGLVACGVMLLIAVAVTYIRRSRSTGTHEHVEALSTGSVPEAERLFRLMGEAEELAARLTTELDEKARHLEHLLRQADARAATLDRRPAPPSEPGRVVTRPMNLATAIHGPSPIASFSAQPHASGTAPAAQRAAAPRPAPAPMPVAPYQPAPAPMSAPMPATPVEGAADPIVAEIYRLADQGVESNAIAAKLSQHIGKVELILALRQA